MNTEKVLVKITRKSRSKTFSISFNDEVNLVEYTQLPVVTSTIRQF